MTQLSLNNMTEEDVKWVLNKENLLRRIPVGAEGANRNRLLHLLKGK